jgi:hypothetical protein
MVGKLLDANREKSISPFDFAKINVWGPDQDDDYMLA